jgi:hypothetical protein
MTGSHKKFIPENSNNRAVILAPQGFARNCLRFYATLGGTYSPLIDGKFQLIWTGSIAQAELNAE